MSTAAVRFVWLHPEWWALVVSAGAWAVLLRLHAEHVHTTGAMLANWLVMTLAMMLPMVVMPIRVTAERSLWRRRNRAIAGFLAGYIGGWMLVGVAALFLPPVPAAAAFGVAGVWQLTRWKRAGLAGCHRTVPLAPRGWRADRDCAGYGLRIGSRCILSCWALMLACFFSGHALVATLLVTAVMFGERFLRRPDHRLFAAALFAAAIVAW